MSSPTPLFIVREDASLEPLGQWHHAERTLEFTTTGFPFLSPGHHTLGRKLPWLFADMAPAGFIGARFAQAFPELGLPTERNHWSAAQCLSAISQRGEDLSGNVIVGETSRRRFETEFAPAIRDGSLKRSDYGAVVEEFMAPGAFGKASSLGGQRPKLLLHAVGNLNPRDCLLKFTPPLTTSHGVRWKNLLIVEHLCARTLAAHGISAVGSDPNTFQVFPNGARAALLLHRFDRIGLLGRRGAATLYWLALTRGELELEAPAVMRSLAGEGLVTAEEAERVDLVHAFSHAIGNTDAHLGNYGLLFDRLGHASLAPMFDVTAMVLAPVADELPDPRIRQRSRPIDPRVVTLVESLVELARADDRLDAAFKELWFRYLGV